MDKNVQIEEYLQMTGQNKQELFAGAQAFGYDYLLNDILPKAMNEGKKIVWKDEPEKGLGAMSFTLEDI